MDSSDVDPIESGRTADATAPDWIVTFVHGTWARGFVPKPSPPGEPYWYEDGSRFRRDLDRHLAHRSIGPVHFDALEWSGSNSLRARNEAASCLAERLAAQHARYPSARLLVIAHSHGGNVALDVPNRMVVKELPLSVVTLATPFLEVTAPATFVWNTERMAFAATLIAVLTNLWRVLPTTVSPGLALLAAAPGLALLGWFSYQVLHERWARQRRETAYVDRLAAAASHEFFHRSHIPLLVLRGIDDEASLAISTALVGRRVSHLVRDTLLTLFGGRLTRWLLTPLIVAVLAASFVLDPADATMLQPLSVVFDVMYWGALAILACIVFADLCTGAVGRELIGLRNLEISVNSVPDARRDLWVRTYVREGRPRSFIRHGVYDEPTCAVDIASWMKDRTLTDSPSWTIGQEIIVRRVVASAMDANARLSARTPRSSPAPASADSPSASPDGRPRAPGRDA